MAVLGEVPFLTFWRSNWVTFNPLELEATADSTGGSLKCDVVASRVLDEEVFKSFYMNVFHDSQKSSGPLDGVRRRFSGLSGSHSIRLSPEPPQTARVGA